MPQIHFSVGDETVKLLTERAAAEGMTLSRYVARLVGQSVASEWPEGYLESVIGSCSQYPLVVRVAVPRLDPP